MQTTVFIIFREILINQQMFFSPQVKRSTITNNKYCIYELHHELSNSLGLNNIKDLGNIKKFLKFHRIKA